jgi:hypothetical protein
MTKAALAAYQTAKGITPAVGYFGPLTRTSVNGETPATPGTPGSTPAANQNEGYFIAKISGTPSNSSNLTAGSDKAVLGIEIEAKQSDIKVQRADLQFKVEKGSPLAETNPSNFIKSISLYDGSTQLLKKDVTSSDFTKGGSIYYVRVTGFNFAVAQGSKKTLTVKVDTATGLDSARVLTVSLGAAGQSSSAIRGVDNAGIDSNGGFAENRVHTFKTGSDSTVTLSTDSSNPVAKSIAVDADNGVDDVVVAVVKLKSTVGDSTVTDIRLTASSSVSTSTPTTLKIYDGSTVVDSMSVPANGVVDFTDLSLAIAKDASKVLTIKADYPAGARGTSTVTFWAANSTYETPDGSSTAFDGSNVTGEVITLQQYATDIVFLTKNVVPTVQTNQTGSTTALSANIQIKLTPMGADLTEPVAGDFVIKAATSSAGTPTITVSNVGFSVTPDTASNLIADGVSATVTLTPTLYNSDLSANGTYYFYVYSVKSQLSGQAAVTQTWALEDFKTLSASAVK